MRRPTTVERLYLDFDGFFASVEQQARPALRGRPVGVIPFRSDSNRTIVIACSREAKIQGVKSIMPVPDARRVCPDIVFVPQTPDLYRRAHNALLADIEAVIPVDAVKSIDELTCRVEARDQRNPRALGTRIKNRIREHIGPHITCSIGFAANRQLAKMACKAGKWSPDRRSYGDGLTIWRPEDMPGPDAPAVGAGDGGDRSHQSCQCADHRLARPLDAAPRRVRRRQDQLHTHTVGGGFLVSWKHELKLTDLAPEERLEITCRVCGKLRYESADVLIFATSHHYSVAEVEQQLKCTRRGCGGPVRIARVHGGKMEGFVGGMA